MPPSTWYCSLLPAPPHGGGWGVFFGGFVCFMFLCFGLSEFRSVPALFGSLLGLCFGLGLLQVWWNLKSTTSLLSALFWGGTLRFLLAATPYLTFFINVICFFRFWSKVFLPHFFWVVQAVQKAFCSQKTAFMDSLRFLRASGFVVFSSRVAMFWFMLLFCGRCYVFSCALVVHQLIYVVCWSFFPLMFFIISGGHQVSLFSFLICCCVVVFFVCLFYCGSWCCYGFTTGFREIWLILAVTSVVSLLSQCLGFGSVSSCLVDLGADVT